MFQVASSPEPVTVDWQPAVPLRAIKSEATTRQTSALFIRILRDSFPASGLDRPSPQLENVIDPGIRAGDGNDIRVFLPGEGYPVLERQGGGIEGIIGQAAQAGGVK